MLNSQIFTNNKKVTNWIQLEYHLKKLNYLMLMMP